MLKVIEVLAESDKAGRMQLLRRLKGQQNVTWY